ncbi:MAG: nitroreductase family protein [Dehalococcoidia bacterium]
MRPIFRPEGVRMGVMRADPKKCTRTRGSSCQLCWENCGIRAWELVEGQEPRLAEDHACISCNNCVVACPRGAISVVEPYHVEEGYFVTLPHRVEWRLPAKPLDAEGHLDELTPLEKAVLNRRSVRNFKEKPVPEHLLRRVLEAGRFAPSGANCQPWRFVVISDTALLNEMNEAIWSSLSLVDRMYADDEMVKQLAAAAESTGQAPGSFDPRVALGAIRSLARLHGAALHGAPVVILILEDQRAASAGGINVGICGQNMTLVANSLGLGACWVGFTTVLSRLPGWMDRLGIEPPWRLATSLALGYPKFKQEGIVPREYRPVTWFRDGAGPVDE